MPIIQFDDSRASPILMPYANNCNKTAGRSQKFVASQVREGTYRSREAAIVAAVSHQMRRSEQMAWLQSEIQKGLDSDQPVNSILKRSSGAVVVGLPLAPAGLGANAASDRALSRSACRLRCHLRLHRTQRSMRSGSSASLTRLVDPTTRGSATIA